MPLTTNFKNVLLSAICGKRQFTNSIYAALSSTDPAGTVTEPSAQSYSRAAISVYNNSATNKMRDPENGSITNGQTIYFPEAEEAWGNVAYVALYDAITGGTLIGYAHIVDDNGDDATLTVAAHTVPLIRAGQFTLAFVDAEEAVE